MATYSDSKAGYADFQSTGRYFARAMAASIVIVAAATYAVNGHLPGVVPASVDLAIVGAIGMVALGVGLVLALAVAGSLMITCRTQRSIVVSPAGVSRISHKDEIFLRRDEIVGMVEIPGMMPRGNRIPRASMALVTADPRRQILIPNTLKGYGACLSELDALGIPKLPAFQRTWAQRLAAGALQAAAFCEMVLIVHGTRSPLLEREHLAASLGGLALFILTAGAFARVRSHSGGWSRPSP